MKKVLFISYFFPPLLPSHHVMAFSKYLHEFGWQPIVISAAESVTYEKDYDLLKGLPENLPVYRVAHRASPLPWRYLRLYLKMAADFPDPYRNWYSPAHKQAREIFRKEKISLIYSESPAYTAHFVAMKLKKDFHIPWVADFGDGWAVNDFLDMHFDRTLIRPLRWFHKLRIKKAERNILTTADKIVCPHSHVIDRWCQLHNLPVGNMQVVTNGYDESAFDDVKPDLLYPDRLTIVFLGTFYPQFRDTLEKFARAVYEIDREAELVFIGRASVPVHEMNLPNTTCILQLPKRKAIELSLGASFLLLIMPPYAKWTPMKTYDYLRIGKPILALVPRDGDSARTIQEAKAGFILPFDQQEMREELKGVLERWKAGEFERFRPDHAYLSKFEWTRLAEQMGKVFDTISP